MFEQKINFAEIEKKILKFWQDKKIFVKSLKQTQKSEIFSFYDGPPFATGLPHYGHLVAGLIKDVVPRYQTMRGKYVPRRWGWDCHGLPIENLIEQELNLKDKKDIEEKIGIDKFNEFCHDSVLRYAKEWRKTVERTGRWVDMNNDYKTMDVWYMESIWWVFKQLWDKGLIYQGYKSMHICPRCGTTLSNFEVTQNYQDIKDLSVIAKFELTEEPGTYILAWTTTPWTLPGNVALALGEEINYVKVESGGKNYILAQDNLEQIFANQKYKIIDKIKAKELVGKNYKPIFDYFANVDLENKKNIYTIQLADFVTVEDGTGVVHIAPGFGEDDMSLGKEKNLPMIKHVDPTGRFTTKVNDFAGELVKPKQDPQVTDRKIIAYLEKGGLVFKTEEFTHSYPFCWRCDTPLLNYATTSWFVKVTAIKKDLIKNNERINWVPSHLKMGRFGRWLEDANDWAISRSRYWGTPLPVWRCECGENIVVGSRKELEKLGGKKIQDLHKHIVDKIEFGCEKCGKMMRRIPEVLDCWFESGSMPYAQQHYPFENFDNFKRTFPAQFIAEGIDQTRGWFYTLLVLSTALFNKPSYLNVIANGIVLAEDGTKMSKRLKNYPEPDIIMEKYGADALRYYLLASPVMEGENLNFSEKGVKESLQNVVILLYNVFSFYQLYANNIKIDKPKGKNILDRWILTKLHLLIKSVTRAMDTYCLVKAARPIQEFINELSTWYVRRSRGRFKSGEKEVVATLGYVLRELSKIMAPFTPFVADYIYRELRAGESVHLDRWPKFDKKRINEKLISEMELVRKITELGHAIRAEEGIRVRQPLQELRIMNYELRKDLVDLIKEELNVKEIEFVKEIGERKGWVLKSKGDLTIALNTILTDELKNEGITRELIRHVNALRKEAGLTIHDKINVFYETENKSLTELVKETQGKIKKDTISEGIKEKLPKEIKYQKKIKLKGEEIEIGIEVCE